MKKIIFFSALVSFNVFSADIPSEEMVLNTIKHSIPEVKLAIVEKFKSFELGNSGSQAYKIYYTNKKRVNCTWRPSNPNAISCYIVKTSFE